MILTPDVKYEIDFASGVLFGERDRSVMAGGKKHLGYGCGYVEDIRGAEHRRRKERAQKGDSAGWRSYALNRTDGCVSVAGESEGLGIQER